MRQNYNQNRNRDFKDYKDYKNNNEGINQNSTNQENIQPPNFLNTEKSNIILTKDDREIRAQQNRRRILEDLERQKQEEEKRNQSNNIKDDIEKPVFKINGNNSIEENIDKKEPQFKEINVDVRKTIF